MQSVLKLSKAQLGYLLLCILLGALFEILQYINIAYGTADIYDVVVYGAGTISAIVVILIIKKCKGESL